MKIIITLPDRLSFINKDKYCLDLLDTVELLLQDSSIIDSFIRTFSTTSVKLGYEIGDTINTIDHKLFGIVCIDKNDEVIQSAFIKGLEESLETIGDSDNNILIIMPNLKNTESVYYKNKKVEKQIDLKDAVIDLHSVYVGSSKLAQRELSSIRDQLSLNDNGIFN